MTHTPTSQALKTMNFIVGLALLAMLCPVDGTTPAKPAGVRTAIELIDKRGAKSGGSLGGVPFAASAQPPNTHL